MAVCGRNRFVIGYNDAAAGAFMTTKKGVTTWRVEPVPYVPPGALTDEQLAVESFRDATGYRQLAQAAVEQLAQVTRERDRARAEIRRLRGELNSTTGLAWRTATARRRAAV